ncbi:MEDS: MEthanogen/methylotroph, DcmR Sensory domain [Halopenitus persicus]|uniref:MEDS: MEthanogen/methylotroph, DcmR Sensory domain n=1 Tax=Halopenitus persicus TaxID=1048396 RepID=A0A1H3HRA0_9EURY|nr:MEDS: MEthanogen/methylotroph, DcmR Sensory domain [Halopenitus persicus]
MSTPESEDRSSPTGTDALRYESLRAAFDREELGRHLALFYDTTAEQLRAAAAFLEAALTNDRRCLYLADANETATIESALEAAGIDVDRRIDAGDLEIAEASDVYSPGTFDPDRTVELLADRAREADASERHEGLCVAGDLELPDGVGLRGRPRVRGRLRRVLSGPPGDRPMSVRPRAVHEPVDRGGRLDPRADRLRGYAL